MIAPTAKDFASAMQELSEGIPGENDPHETGTGELDNGPVRLLLASAAWTVIRFDPGIAFDSLGRFVESSELSGWFATKRLELIFRMLLYQTNWCDYSTWLSRYQTDLWMNSSLPDPRWKELCASFDHESPELNELARELARRLERDRDFVQREKDELRQLLRRLG